MLRDLHPATFHGMAAGPGCLLKFHLRITRAMNKRLHVSFQVIYCLVKG
jgi:hypothetical protein